jgi:hypothetical protein
MEPRGNEDVLYGGNDGANLIPKNTLIYVCRSGDEACDKGTGKAVFDGYWRTDTPITNDIKFCSKRPTDIPDVPYAPRDAFPIIGDQVIISPETDESQNSLQIGTFSITQQKSSAFIADWLTPYCACNLSLP